MFHKILIANRGEIACRIIATARKMGIRSVAVYSDADKQARHTTLADEAVHIGPAPARASYLLAERIIAACRQTGAQAVHPGYGFLSENPDFARRCEEEGIVFIGPKAHSIAAMGDKIASRKLAQAAGVHTIPGHNEAIGSPEQAREIARSIGYPVMIKASAGGGGKGLRVAGNDQEVVEGFASCRSEARNSFGDERVFIEKFVQQPRHIEIQVLGDSHGNLIYLNERECSLQRRHQKVVEEAPSPFISDATRQAMGAQAVQLAKAVQYQSAGTVEFVVGKEQDFYFLEMNTRLQVEHPVTECITGLDLVELMIRVAAGEKLPLTQAEVRRDGWAIECRINAEDPGRNFLPSTGRLVRFLPPEPSLFQSDTSRRLGLRVDTGVYEGGEIPMHYDSMIAKLIVHGSDRSDAIARMRAALDGFVIRGIRSNIPFQAALLAHPKFVAGDFNTGFIAEHYGQGFDAQAVPHEAPLFLVALAAYMNRRYRARASGISGQLAGHEVKVGEAFVVVVLDAQGQHRQHPVTVTDFEDKSGSSAVAVADKSYQISSQATLGQIRVQGQCNGLDFTAQVERGVGKNPLALRIAHNGAQIDALVLSPLGARLHQLMPFKAAPDLSRFLLSPMPGLLVDVAVQPGQKVQAGEKLAVIEAMKMENILFAAQDAVVDKIVAGKGESLAVDQVIMQFQ
ncbi:acetyl-CoA carboxylase biotin carboxylase subunit [Verminephrobacter eiseniae]|uniref:acetyl-CoA carboxylase biotin carboxylase subunit n=1 Tax=Verminephrobacter eiseniae TaxID=364317 RepID=UPI00223815F7|nr:acetyl/propionyl/methylcrotonyl-CoA carboxylase subunit alpha [Verminephrobacter eiseniae]MCW5231265.1 acetyl/propionyl/methylcrotonyl-CoA carboxylase subunit alpha [Verminephrobacter eiseniae]MCW5292997.1 acetyl/propionyl/methylcrotonyl-CoA carboxylase subunit alpha [Verminephrobacter eiseniae]MCW8184390.1 acetyl/propionyl/methylcrotonyl-CoA carboxylase subunit alpha [Verminephrobacter eiseniae]MCW8221486.1 acetyl/propionyl/methylcrotonyl-CoA carboxylase subunit alpha [Verminephrobacter eis